MYDNKSAYSYLVDSTSCTLHLRITRQPCETEGRVSVNSTDGPGELPLLPPPQPPSLPGATAFCGLTAGQSLSYSNPLGFGCGAGEEVVRPRDVGLRRVTPVQLCVPLKKASVSTGRTEFVSNKK
jgi:hypothetical protein